MLNACVLLPVVAFTCDAVNGLAVRELAHSHEAKLTEQLFCLRCLSGDFEGREFGVDSQGFIIGRNPSFANVVLSDDEVSGKHVRVWQDAANTSVWIEDLKSRNGDILPASAR